VVDGGVELTGAQFGAFFYNVIDEAGESFMLYSLSGAPRSAFEAFPMPRNTAVFAPTFDGEGVVRSDDITRDRATAATPPRQGMPEGHLPVRSYLAVPVITRQGACWAACSSATPNRPLRRARREPAGRPGRPGGGGHRVRRGSTTPPTPSWPSAATPRSA
jgi:hypothetical protein